MSDRVALVQCHVPAESPYPTFPFEGPNAVYDAVSRALERLGISLDGFVEPGQTVLIKPNWVLHRNGEAGDLSCMVAQTAVLRPLIDGVLKALQGRGRLILGDAPIQSADFAELMRRTRVPDLVDRLDADGVALDVRDLRATAAQMDARGALRGHRRLVGDPRGYVTVDLRAWSLLEDVSDRFERFRVTNYDPAAMRAHHAPGRHEYLVARSVLDADVVISVPKLKTHRKAGFTCALKNVVGINGSKDYLPHHRQGSAAHGGDEYPYPSFWKARCSRLLDHIEAAPDGPLANGQRFLLRACRRMARHFARDVYDEGSWFGNDTIWRTILDLNRVLEFATSDGTISDVPQRRILHVVDAIVCGEGEGPLRPDPVCAGMILAGRNAAFVDAFASRLCGLDPQKIPVVREALARVEGTPRLLADAGQAQPPDAVMPVVCLKPPAGWAGHVELAMCPSTPPAAPSAGRTPLPASTKAEE